MRVAGSVLALALASCAGADGAPVDDAAPDAPADVSLFEVDPGDDSGCGSACTLCGVDDGCGGFCKTGTCPGNRECDAGRCVCVPYACTTCGADDGCGNPCQTGSCPGGLGCIAGRCGAATVSFLAPPSPPHFYTGTWGYIDAFARNYIASIGAEDPSTIFYTTDGSAPGPSSPHKPSPMTLGVSTSGMTLRWYADDGIPEGARSATIAIDARLQTYYGYLVDVADLGGGSPIAVVSPGATVNGTANWQAWTMPLCATCRYQLVYGVDDVSAGCLYDGAVGAWPGTSRLSAPFTMTAPATTGVHKVNVTYALQLSCATAMSQSPLGARPTETIAWLVVQ